MGRCDLEIHLDQEDASYRGGGSVGGKVVVRAHKKCSCTLTISVSWRTRGRGDRDRGPLTRESLFEGSWLPGDERSYPFRLDLPSGPGSYSGHLFGVQWVLEARADLGLGRHETVEKVITVVPDDSGESDGGPGEAEPVIDLSAPPLPEAWRGFFDATEERRPSTLQLIGFGILAAVLMIGYLELSQEHDLPDLDRTWIWVLLTVVLAAVSAFLRWLWRRFVGLKLGTPEVIWSARKVPRGGILEVQVHLEPAASVQLTRVSGRLLAREWVREGSPIRSRVRQDGEMAHRLYAKQILLSGRRRRVRRGERGRLDGAWEIPSSAPLTFASGNHRVEWSASIRVGVSGWASWERVYPITVCPSLG